MSETTLQTILKFLSVCIGLMTVALTVRIVIDIIEKLGGM
jgi:hypothetical protein